MNCIFCKSPLLSEDLKPSNLIVYRCKLCRSSYESKFSVYFHENGNQINYVRFYIDNYEVYSFTRSSEEDELFGGLTTIWGETTRGGSRQIVRVEGYTDVFALSLQEVIDKINLYVLMS
jgi:hypothetical protein